MIEILSTLQTLPISFKVKDTNGNIMNNVNLTTIAGSNIYSYFENARDKKTIQESLKPEDIKITGNLHVVGTKIVPTY